MSGKASEIFSPRLALILIAVVLVSMIGALFTASFKEEEAVSYTVGSNSFSSSAIGHKAFAESLKKEGMLSLVSQYRTRSRLTPQTILMLLEPSFNSKDPQKVKNMLAHSIVLVSLPKWWGRRDRLNRRWLARASLLRPKVPLNLLKMIDPAATIYRPHAPVKEDKKDNKEEPSAPPEKKPLKWTVNYFGFVPDLVNPQLIKSDKIIPLLATEEGILVGSVRGLKTTIVIADPDILSNFGLGRGQNPQLVAAIMNLLYDEGTAVVIDETSHGFVRNPDIIRAAFNYPFIAITVQVIIFSCFLVWMTTQRFGAPRRVEEVLKPGKSVLIKNTVGLLEKGKHQPEILVRYIEYSWRALARKLRVPKNLDEVSAIAWLDHYGQQKGARMKLETIRHRAKMLNTNRGTTSFLDQVHEKPLMQIIEHFETWKREMLDGSATD